MRLVVSVHTFPVINATFHISSQCKTLVVFIIFVYHIIAVVIDYSPLFIITHISKITFQQCLRSHLNKSYDDFIDFYKIIFNNNWVDLIFGVCFLDCLSIFRCLSFTLKIQFTPGKRQCGSKVKTWSQRRHVVSMLDN